MQLNVRRYISQFPRSTQGENALIQDIDATHIPLDVLRDTFQPPPHDPLLYDGYELGPSQVVALQPFLPVALDLADYEFYLHAEAAG